MVEEYGAGLHLLMSVPGVEEIAHDQDNVTPAFHVLEPLFLFGLEQQLVEDAFFLVLTHTVAGLTIQIVHHGVKVRSVAFEPAKIYRAQPQPFEDLGRKDLKFCAANASLICEQVIDFDSSLLRNVLAQVWTLAGLRSRLIRIGKDHPEAKTLL